MERRSLYNTVKGAITAISTYIGSMLEVISPAIILFIFLMVVDYFSGMLASKKEAAEHPNDVHYGWSSKKSIIGIYKKIGYMITIVAAISIDYIVYALLGEVGVAFKHKTVFGLLVTVWFIINELLSILENTGRMGVTLPKFIQNVLAELKKDIDRYDEK